MTGEATSPAVARWTPNEWRAFAAFLRRPTLPEQVIGIRPSAIAGTAKLFALDIVLMATLLSIVGIATVFGFKLPENAIDSLQLDWKWLAVIVVGAPLLEELIFRSWLSGRPGHVAAMAALLVGVTLPVISGPHAHPILLLGSLATAVVVAIGLVVWLRRRPPMAFFARHFVWFYAAATLLFALAHLSNYSQGAALILLPLVVPQLIVGLVLGYARVTYGLWSDMLLHMMHNGLLIIFVVMQKGL